MQDFYNATDASRIIGISYKTMLRRLEEGKIEAVKGDDGQYSIAAAEVERLRILQSTRPRPVKSTVVLSGQDQSALEQRVTDLEDRVRTLEAVTSQDHTPLVATGQQKTTVDIPPKTKAPKRNIAPSGRSVDGAIGLSDFAAQHGISLSSASRWVKNGDIPTEQRQRAGRPQHFLTIEQQEQALEWMKKYGKLS